MGASLLFILLILNILLALWALSVARAAVQKAKMSQYESSDAHQIFRKDITALKQDVSENLHALEPLELRGKMERKEPLLLLDVRENIEYQSGHLSGAKLIPLGGFSKVLQEMDKDKDIVVYCQYGERSASAVASLMNAGYCRVKNLRGGLNHWYKVLGPAAIVKD